MSVLRTHAAAAMLGVSPNTLRSWERRFGYPAPRRTAGGHRQFELAARRTRRLPRTASAWRWAWGWLAAAKRVAPPPTRSEGVLIFDATAPCDIDALHALAFELFLRRAGVRTLMLTAELDAGRVAHVLQVLTPHIIVLTGRRSWLDALASIAYGSRRTASPMDVLDFRGALAECDATTVPRLGTSAVEARDRLLARINARDGAARGRPALAQIS